jgi:hypothetical protein
MTDNQYMIKVIKENLKYIKGSLREEAIAFLLALESEEADRRLHMIQVIKEP